MCLEVVECANEGVSACAREGGHRGERGKVSSAWVGAERGVGVSVSSEECMVGTRGEVAGRAGVCARGVCGDLAGCMCLADCPRDTNPWLWRSWAPGVVGFATAQAFRLTALLAPCAGTVQVPGVGDWGAEGPHILSLPHVRAALLPELKGHDLKVGIRPPILPRVPST